MTVTTLALFLFCDFGNRVTQRYEDVGDKVYQMAWYSFPLNIQKKLKSTIAISQKNIYVRGAEFETTREMFMRVLNNYSIGHRFNLILLFPFLYS